MAAADWPTVPLGELLEPVSRPVRVEPATTYRSIGVRWYGEGVFTKDAKVGSEIAATRLYEVEPRDVVYSRLFAWKGSFGVVLDEHSGCVASGEFPIFRACDLLLPEFFAIWSSQPSIWRLAEAESTGTTANSRFRLKQEAFLAFELALPPVGEQRRIVTMVGRADAVVAGLDREIAAIENLRIAARESLLGATSGSTPLGDLLVGIDGGLGSIPKCDDRPPAEGEWGIVKVSAIRPGRFFPQEAKTLPSSVAITEKAKIRAGDVLLTRCSGSKRFVAAACRVPTDPERLVLTDFVLRLNVAPEKADPDYVVEALASRGVREQIERDIERSTTLRSVSKTRLRELIVPTADLEEQQTIAAQLNELRSAEERLRLQRDRALVVRQALVAGLLGRELHVPESATV